MLQGFKKFLLRGNVVELATAVVIGAAFTGIVTAFTQAIIDPLLAMAFDADALADATVGPFRIGLLLAAVINFLIVAAVVYFALIFPMTKLKERIDRRRGVAPDEPAETDIEILQDIRELLRAQQAQTPPSA
ncbi:large conductance mechanosensitive channel protein MscL [Agrococcus sp. HG114]|uniref:large conductance mechanosensitive channel protein MscL n=1 Tax=Agrococcus sp. HG114 TaxID=2969757 RepID=UPI00215B5591|nr:large conductance mechanosensitive channel protein MscL [Agrococcus sp. HG114]MCR8670243.1 large conductance mechanosensitive channel protein MscL [Agrococcus sp. HG114]